jgi:hypothetical protein
MAGRREGVTGCHRTSSRWPRARCADRRVSSDVKPTASSEVRRTAAILAALLRLFDDDPEFRAGLLALLAVAEAAGLTEPSVWWQTHVGLWNLAAQPWERLPQAPQPPRLAAIVAFVGAVDTLVTSVGSTASRPRAVSTSSAGVSRSCSLGDAASPAMPSSASHDSRSDFHSRRSST